MSALTYDVLKNTVAGSAAAFRMTIKLEAVSPKVFPPTYEGGKYATETRRIDGQDVPCVLLDSVQSQANRMELALQGAWEAGSIALPVVSVDFSALKHPGVPRVTSLQAPHRIVDAILRDSLLKDQPIKFRASEIGKELDQLSIANATPLLKYAPHCLVFGMWDSTGPRGGLGVKFARAMVSEIIGVNASAGVSTGSRLDPLNIQKLVDKEDESGVAIYSTKAGGWTLKKDQAELDSKGKPMLYGKKGKPSEINHGNVTPDIVYRRDRSRNLIRDENGKPIPIGGFTVDYAEQTTVLSLPALRRLRFPLKVGDRDTTAADIFARTYLAALGLLGATLAIEAGYDLRSRCILRAKAPVQWQLLGKPGDEDQTFNLSAEQALALYQQALGALREGKLPIHTDEITLVPTDDLTTLVKKSMELSAAETNGEAD
jgi:CRISPR-associated protein Csb1